MSNIYEQWKLYPHDGKILDHFKNEFECAFIAFLPFFTIENKFNSTGNFKKSKIISLSEAKENLEVLKNIQETVGTIYSYNNEDYPTEEEIYFKGKVVKWSTIVEQAKFEDISELNKALRTSIGALKEIFQKPELAKKMELYTSKKKIYNPAEGDFDIISKKNIYNVFKDLNKNKVMVFDEFYENSKAIEIDKLREWEFIQKIEPRDHFIYSDDKEILFTIDWDSFFFIIATNKVNITKIINQGQFEGFLCDNKTEHEWDYKEGEVEEILKRENKKWWQFWI